MIRDALLEEVEKSELITIHMGKTIESYDDDTNESQIEVVIKDVDSSKSKTSILNGSLLIAADGGE